MIPGYYLIGRALGPLALYRQVCLKKCALAGETIASNADVISHQIKFGEK